MTRVTAAQKRVLEYIAFGAPDFTGKKSITARDLRTYGILVERGLATGHSQDAKLTEDGAKYVGDRVL